MDSKITIELDDDDIHRIAYRSMCDCVKNLELDLRARKATGMAIFHKDKKKDIAEIKRNINAIKTVLEYYGEVKDE
jgi:ribosomal protein L29